MRTERGFTLIELLIVITIIAILSAIGLVSYTNFMKGSRDVRRQSDIKIIQSALEQYYADQKYYPTVLTSPLLAGNKSYLTKMPVDPKGSPGYQYVPSPAGCNNVGSNCSSYCLFVNLEGAVPSSDVNCSPTTPYNHGVARP